jgi:inorganic pyrophosphatase
MKLPGVYAADKKSIHVIIETPYKSRNKFAYQPQSNLYILKKVLPAGLAFPCDMGFIPGTRGEDGDPLDALILMDELTYPGCLIEGRLLGVIRATQNEKGKEAERNDRFVLVPANMKDYDHLKKIADLNKNKIEAIINFFTNYNAFEGKEFIVEGLVGPAKGKELIKKYML